MHNTMAMLQEMVEDTEQDLRLELFRGELKKMGRLPGAEFRYTDNGTPMFRGNVAPSFTVVKDNGEEFSFTANMPMVGFGDVAEELMSAEEGTRVQILANYNRRKNPNGDQWFTEGQILAVDILD